MTKILNMNLELTTACPLRCPQCYCSFQNAKHMDFGTAMKWIDEGANFGVKNLALSGGETLCYPRLFDVIRYGKTKGMSVAAAFSGWKLNQEVVQNLVDAGIDNICISLNGSTEEINAYTRQGYQYAIEALQLLHNLKFKYTIINWVMHSNNADDFPNIIKIAEEYGVNMIDVISFKPDSKKEIKSFPTKEQIYCISNIIKDYRGPVKITVEKCFSQLLAILCDTKLFGNLNVGINRGCRAGISIFSVNVDGSLSPCRHIHYKENYDSLEAYFEKSEVISRLRNCTENEAQFPCQGCKYVLYCRPCMAINTEIFDTIAFRNDVCPINADAYSD